jgi:hypothetical protein
VADHETQISADTNHSPDFELPRHDAIHEDNWAEYQAQGFLPVPEDLKSTQNICGIENVFTGDSYDYDTGRPLRHKPGSTVYVSPAGLKRREAWFIEHRELLRSVAQDSPDGGPTAS